MSLKKIEILLQNFTDMLYNITDYLADSQNLTRYNNLVNGIKVMTTLKDYVWKASIDGNDDEIRIAKCSNEWKKISFKLSQLISYISELGADTTKLDSVYNDIADAFSIKRSSV